MKPLLLIFSGLLAGTLLITNSSCQKQTDCKATVNCTDSLGNAVANANIVLYAPVKNPNDPKGIATYTGDVKATGTTDAGGQVQFNFKLPAIFDIKATMVVGTRTLSGASIIKLEEGKNVNKTVSIK